MRFGKAAVLKGTNTAFGFDTKMIKSCWIQIVAMDFLLLFIFGLWHLGEAPKTAVACAPGMTHDAFEHNRGSVYFWSSFPWIWKVEHLTVRFLAMFYVFNLCGTGNFFECACLPERPGCTICGAQRCRGARSNYVLKRCVSSSKDQVKLVQLNQLSSLGAIGDWFHYESGWQK